MKSKFGAAARPNKPSAEAVTLDELVELGRSPKHLFPGQRNHDKTLPRKQHVQCVLTGDALVFHAVRCAKPARLWLLDGYHRTLALARGLASLPAGAQPLLIIHAARNIDEANTIYEQLNSLQAAKRSGDAFDSALRACGTLNEITSPQILKGGRATAAQLAADMIGSKHTKEAAIRVMDGIRFVNQLQLNRPRFEIAGVLGVHFVVAQHCPNARLAEDFIRCVNAAQFAPQSPTAAERAVQQYRAFLVSGNSTGGAANKAAFVTGLAAFMRYANARKGKKAFVPSSLVLDEFVRLVQKIA